MYWVWILTSQSLYVAKTKPWPLGTSLVIKQQRFEKYRYRYRYRPIAYFFLGLPIYRRPIVKNPLSSIDCYLLLPNNRISYVDGPKHRIEVKLSYARCLYSLEYLIKTSCWIVENHSILSSYIYVIKLYSNALCLHAPSKKICTMYLNMNNMRWQNLPCKCYHSFY